MLFVTILPLNVFRFSGQRLDPVTKQPPRGRSLRCAIFTMTCVLILVGIASPCRIRSADSRQGEGTPVFRPLRHEDRPLTRVVEMESAVAIEATASCRQGVGVEVGSGVRDTTNHHGERRCGVGKNTMTTGACHPTHVSILVNEYLLRLNACFKLLST